MGPDSDRSESPSGGDRSRVGRGVSPRGEGTTLGRRPWSIPGRGRLPGSAVPLAHRPGLRHGGRPLRRRVGAGWPSLRDSTSTSPTISPSSTCTPAGPSSGSSSWASSTTTAGTIPAPATSTSSPWSTGSSDRGPRPCSWGPPLINALAAVACVGVVRRRSTPAPSAVDRAVGLRPRLPAGHRGAGLDHLLGGCARGAGQPLEPDGGDLPPPACSSCCAPRPSTGRRCRLIGAVLVGSFIVQTNISTLILVAALWPWP